MIVIRGKNNMRLNPEVIKRPGPGDVKSIVLVLERNQFFSHFTAEQLQKLAKSFYSRREPRGYSICRQGEEGDAIYLLTRGRVNVIRNDGDADELIYTAGPGELLGEIAVLGDIPRTASLRAASEIEFLQMSRTDFIAMLSVHPDMALKVTRLMVRRLAENMEHKCEAVN